MDSIEKAIRNAFQKGDPSERAFREKVYRSAFAALDRALQSTPNMTVAVAMRRREAMSAAIAQIESEFLPAVPSVEPVAAAPAPHAAAPARVEPPSRREPAFEPEVTPRDRPDYEPAPDAYDDARTPSSYEHRGRGAPRRRSWLSPVLSLLVLALVAVGAWWVFASGPVGGSSPQQGAGRPASPSEPPRAVGNADDLADWITIFDPADPTTVNAQGGARAEMMEEDGQSFMRITAGGAAAPVLFDVGPGILEQIAGRRAVFNIVARAREGEETQISVECNLGELGDCGRRRYDVGVTREEFLFEVTLPSASPRTAGTIAINSDVENGGRAVDIHAIRVAPAQ